MDDIKSPFLSNIAKKHVDTKDRWPELLDEIDKGNVIPVIGPDLLVEPKETEDSSGRIENLHQQIISFIARHVNAKSRPRSFSQLVFDPNFQRIVNNKASIIYNLIDQVINNLNSIEDISHEPSQLLMDLLGTKRFPFVITTSFTPIVEQAMEKIWGEVKVYNFTNEPKDGGDIKSEDDLKRPSVLYMLGKYCSNPERYAVTDNDMIEYCGSWIKGYCVPKNLTGALKNKHLLMIGNNDSDWLNRLVWFALRQMSTTEMRSDYVVVEDAEDNFIQFLERLDTFYQEDQTHVIQRIKEEMASRSDILKLTSSNEYDVYISYSRSDTEIARNLYDALTAKGLQVWFDKESIGTQNWEEDVKQGIKNARLFIPILTTNIAKEALVFSEYRNEWNLAAELSEIMGGRTFIIPFAEQGFDFYDSLNKLPKEFHKMNAIWFSDENDVQGIVNTIIEELKKLKEMENKLKS